MVLDLRDYCVQNGNGLSKIERYGWELETGKLTTFKFINKNVLNVDKSYQRPPSETTANFYAKNWNWTAVNVLVVGQRSDGSYWVVDGQHRLFAAMKRADITELPCSVFQSDGSKEEASLFVKLNTARRTANVLERFHADIVCENKDALAIRDLVEKHGFRICYGGKIMSISCIAKVYEYYNNGAGMDILDKTFAIMEPLCKHENMNKSVFSGVAYILKNYDISDLKKFMVNLEKQGQKTIIRCINERSAESSGRRGDKICALGVMDATNIGVGRGKVKFQLKQEIMPGD